MGKKHKRHHKDAKEDIDDIQLEKPTGLKLVLKVGAAPSTPCDYTTDSQSDTFGSDTAVSEKRLRIRRTLVPSEKAEPEDKKRKLDDDDSEDSDDDEEQSYSADKDRISVHEIADAENDVRVRNLRDKRTPEDDNKSALHFCLDYFQKILQRKDGNGFFAFPVTENIAPGYSSLISQPMDFSTMRAKIDAGEYNSVAEYRADYQLMMENCIKYNHPDTVFYREAKRLLSVGLKHMTREQLLLMKRNLPAMSSLTADEMGVDDDPPDGVVSSSESRSKSSKERPSSQRKQGLDRFEAIPDKMTPDEILRQAKSAAKGAADRLSLRAPNSKIGFLRRREDGSTTLNILNPDNSGTVSDKERVINLGELLGKVTSGSGTLIGLKEDRRNKINPVNYLSYGAFSSYGPVYDSSTANLSKEDSDLLLSTYGDETGLQYAKSLQQFVADAGQYSVRMVDNLLDILTNGEHTKTNASLLENEQERMRQEQEEVEKRLELESANKTDQPIQASTVGMSDVEAENQRRLDTLSSMLVELHRLQNARLGKHLPDHLSDVSKPSDEETDLALKISTELAKIVKQVVPSDVVSVQTLRNAMGVSNEPIQTGNVANMSTDVSRQAGNAKSRQETKQTELDQDLNDFFGQAT